MCELTAKYYYGLLNKLAIYVDLFVLPFSHKSRRRYR